MDESPGRFENSGTSQKDQEVFLNRLTSFRLDERSREELMCYCLALASKLNYYNFEDAVEGDWAPFLLEDDLFYTAAISEANILLFTASHERLKQELSLAWDEEKQLSLLWDLLKANVEIAAHLATWRLHMPDAGIAGTMLAQAVVSTVSSKRVTGSVRELCALWLELAMRLRRPMPDAYARIAQVWNAPLLSPPGTEPDPIAQTPIVDLQSRIAENFEILRRPFTKLVFQAKSEFERNAAKGTRKPHIGLLLAFLDMNGLLRAHINELPLRHLDHYYFDTLGFRLRPAHPDQGILVVERKEGAPTFHLAEGTLFKAPTQADRPDLFYESIQPLYITGVRIERIFTEYIGEEILSGEEGRGVSKFHVWIKEHSPWRIPAGGNTTPIKPFAAFGENQRNVPPSLATMSAARMGLQLSSPLFYLEDGHRSLSIMLYMRAESARGFEVFVSRYAQINGTKQETTVYTLLHEAFNCEMTFGNGWMQLHPAWSWDKVKGAFLLKIEIGEEIGPIALFDPDLHGPEAPAPYPCLRLVANPSAACPAFTFFKDIILDRVAIEAHVKGFKVLELRNHIGPLNPEQTFAPFGPLPTVGSFLEIGNGNALNRYTQKARLCLKWMDLPRGENGFADWYARYPEVISNQSFLAKVSSRGSGSDRTQPATVALFQEQDGEHQLLETTEIQLTEGPSMHFTNAPWFMSEGAVAQTGGTLRIELAAPAMAFGHKAFPGTYAEAAIKNSNPLTPWRKSRPLPNTPYTPLATSLTLDYTLRSETVMDSASQAEYDRSPLFMHYLLPIGYREAFPHATFLGGLSMLSGLEPPRSLLIGLSGIEPGQELRLAFGLAERVVYKTFELPEPVRWEYLDGNDWVEFQRDDVLADTTQDLIRSGIVSLRMPTQYRIDGTIMPMGLTWIRAGSRTAQTSTVEVRFLMPNAIPVIRQQSDLVKGSPNLETGCIREIAPAIPAIKAVYQPFPTHSGRAAETKTGLYIRASEQLHHKGRPLRARDYELMLLAAFPELRLVKCLPKSEKKDRTGAVQIVVIPAFSGQEQGGPQLSIADMILLKKIDGYLRDKISPFADLEVGNPVYERLKFSFSVLFTSSLAGREGMLLTQLNEDIRRYLCPWLYDASAHIYVGGSFYLSDFLSYLKGLPYVEYISGLSAQHLYLSEGRAKRTDRHVLTDTARNERQDVIRGSLPSSVFVPATDHIIRILDTPSPQSLGKAGIGTLAVGQDLLLQNEVRPKHGKAHYPDTEPEVTTYTLTLDLI